MKSKIEEEIKKIKGIPNMTVEQKKELIINIDALFSILGKIYGDFFIKQYDNPETRDIWTYLLADLTSEDFAHGILLCTEREFSSVPNLNTFKSMCLKHRNKQNQEIPAFPDHLLGGKK